MRMTVPEAIEAISRIFPQDTVTIEDGGDAYLVGVVENSEQELAASFRLILEDQSTTERLVTDIQVGAAGKYCGTIEASELAGRHPANSVTSLVPIQLTLIDADRSRAWGMVGDYEVCIDQRCLQ